MGAVDLQELHVRAMRGTAQRLGPPVAGKGFTLTMGAGDATQDLEAGAVYRIATGAQPAFIGVADQATASNREYLAANSETFWQTPAAGTVTLHYLQAGTAGTLYLSKHDDVE
jgi:hypothetical protein